MPGYKKDALSNDKASFLRVQLTLKLQCQGVADALEGVVDLLAEGGHHCDHDDGDEGDNNRILNQALALLLGCI